LFQKLNVLSAVRLKVSSFFEKFNRRLDFLSENVSKLVTSPFYAMQSLFREHLHSADWDFIVVFWIFLLTI